MTLVPRASGDQEDVNCSRKRRHFMLLRTDLVRFSVLQLNEPA